MFNCPAHLLMIVGNSYAFDFNYLSLLLYCPTPVYFITFY